MSIARKLWNWGQGKEFAPIEAAKALGIKCNTVTRYLRYWELRKGVQVIRVEKINRTGRPVQIWKMTEQDYIPVWVVR